MKNFIKKYWFIIIIIILSIIRFLMSYRLPSYIIQNLKYDDHLVFTQTNTLFKGNYLGIYSKYTLVKGIIFPLILTLIRHLKLTYSIGLTIIYILCTLYFTLSCKKITNNKIILLIIYVALLFNPLTYSAELFQRLYINTISIPELLLFLGILIRIIYDKDNKILNYILLGIISGIMLLTRNDNIWIYIILLLLFIAKIYKNIKIKNILKNIIPIFIVVILHLLLSFMNYKYYNLFTYNELENSSFNDAYSSLLKIKNDNQDERISITKDTLFKLSEKSKVFNISKETIEKEYQGINEYDNGNMIWFFRYLVYKEFDFKNAKEANEYFKNLNNDINQLFKEGKLEKKPSLPIIYVSFPKSSEIKNIPSSLLDALIYTNTYKNVRTFTKNQINESDNFEYMSNYKLYDVKYSNYRYIENVIETNNFPYEFIRIIYKYLTIILAIPALIIYIINIKKKDNLNNILHIILLVYLIILFGVTYTHITSFHAIRYRYLSNVYILQSIFILFNLISFYNNKYHIRKEGK